MLRSKVYTQIKIEEATQNDNFILMVSLFQNVVLGPWKF